MLSPFDVYLLPSVDQKNGIPFDGFEMAAIVHPLWLLAAFLNDFFIGGIRATSSAPVTEVSPDLHTPVISP